MLILLLSLLGHAAEPPDGADRLPSRALDAGIIELGAEGRIEALAEGSPAWEAGLRTGESVLRIDGLRVGRMSADEIRGRLAPPTGQVTLQVQREGDTDEVALEIEAYDGLNAPIHTLDSDTAERGAFWCVKGDCTDGNGKAEHSSGAVYIGYFADGLFDGYGSWTHPDGSRYDGAWRAGLRHGPGAYRDADKNTFAGVWTEGLMHGPFSVLWDDGRTYEGELRSRLPHGEGTLIWPDGKRYDGSFEYGDFDGEGRLVLPSGETYTGSFQNNIAHGEGVLELEKGDLLEGTFYKGRLEGEGRRVWADDGREFVGTFTANEPDGLGVLKWPDDRMHIGTFVEGEAVGPGVHVFPKGRRIVADFTSEHRGLGYIIDGTDTVIFEGWIVRGKAEGWGRALKDSGEFKRYRFYFNDKPRGDHPRSLELGKEEKQAFELFDWSSLEPLKQVRHSIDQLHTALGEESG